MRNASLFILLSLCASCTRVEVAPYDIVMAPSTLYPADRSRSEPESLLGPVVPNVRLTAKQRKYLDKSLPADVRTILEKAEKFEILAEANPDDTSERNLREFEPNRIVTIRKELQKKEILEAFYSDASTEDGPSACYSPHHSLRATYAGRTVEVEICFSCAQFVVKGSPNTWGTIVRNNRKSELLLTQIVENDGVELNK